MKILLIAYYFPPDSSSGSFRPLFFANHLSAAGDEITVLTCRQEDFLTDQPVDQELIARLDRRVKMVRSAVYRPQESLLRLRDRLTGRSRVAPASAQNPSAKSGNGAGWIHAAKDFITDLIATPDQHAGWIASCVRQGFATARDQRPDVIIATGNPWSGIVAGSLLKRLTGVPLALDFRDPWVANPGHIIGRGRFFMRVDTWLEQHVVANADLLIANTEELRHDFLCRYRNLSPERVVAITNGFEDYLPDPPQRRNDALTLTHAGALYFSRNPRPFLEAARNAIERGRIDPMGIKLRFVGEIAIDNPTIAELLASPSLANSIEVIPRVTYEESLRYMGESDVLILYQPGFPLQVPRKLYDYMATRRPLLCIAEPGSATWSLVERYSLGTACENNVARLEAALLTMYDEWQNGRLKPFIDDRCEPFRNHNLTVRLRNHLEQTIRTSTKNQGAPSLEMSKLKG